MNPISLVVIPVTPFQQNCSLVICTATGKAAVVDPGGDLDRIREAIDQSGATVAKILLTHGHIDHAGGAAELAAERGVPVEGPHRGDEPLLERLAETGLAYAIAGARKVTPDRWLDAGDLVRVGDLAFDVLHVPGHSPGSVVLVWQRSQGSRQGFALMGDVLFRGSVGRTDLPGGNERLLIDGIRSKVLALPDDTMFLPGHGPASTIGNERTSNPFLL